MTSKTKLKMIKFNNLQRQVRTIEEMNPEEHKYIKELLRKIKNENSPTVTRASLRPQNI